MASEQIIFALYQAVRRLEPNAYGVTVHRHMEENGRPVSFGTLDTVLNRLEQEGYVTSYRGDPTPERGYRAKKYWRTTGKYLLAPDTAPTSDVFGKPQPT